MNSWARLARTFVLIRTAPTLLTVLGGKRDAKFECGLPAVVWLPMPIMARETARSAERVMVAVVLAAGLCGVVSRDKPESRAKAWGCLKSRHVVARWSLSIAMP